jgi:hypothetical protein
MMRITSGLAVLVALLVEVLLMAMGSVSVRRLGSDYRETNRYEATFLFGPGHHPSGTHL